MKKTCKWLAVVGTGLMFLTLQAQAVLTGTLTLADNNGNAITVNTAGGVASYNGAVGNWDINVSTGIGSGTSTSPILDLNSINDFLGGAGNVLKITFTVTGIGPLTGLGLNDVGGTLNGISDIFNVLVNGVAVSSLSFNSTPFAGSALPNLASGAGSTLSLQAILTGSANGGLTSFDTHLNLVPDGGATVMLLGAALSGLCLFRKKIMA
jgi:hypothetical protein